MTDEANGAREGPDVTLHAEGADAASKSGVTSFLARPDGGLLALDGAFERAEQQYRNLSKVIAGLFAIALAEVAGAALLPRGQFDLSHIIQALLVGVVAVPLAPVAKDLASSLQAAATAMKAVRS